MSKPSSTNYPNDFFAAILYLISRICQLLPSATDCDDLKASLARLRYTEAKVLLGGYSSEVPPLPIPNREVKLTYADGTAVFPWESR